MVWGPPCCESSLVSWDPNFGVGVVCVVWKGAGGVSFSVSVSGSVCHSLTVFVEVEALNFDL
jgi:hypothetical protein